MSVSTGGFHINNCGFYASLGNGINATGLLTVRSKVLNCYFSTINQASKAAIMNSSGTNTDMIVPIAPLAPPNYKLVKLGFPGLFEGTNVYRGYLDGGATQRVPQGRRALVRKHGT